MMIRIRALPALFVMALLPEGSLQSQPPGAVKSVRISGRVVFPDGRQWPSAPVQMAEVVPAGLSDAVSVLADSKGVFQFDALAGKKYRIYLSVHGELSRKTVETARGTDVAIGDIIVRQCPADLVSRQRGNPISVPFLSLERIVIEPQNFSHGAWTKETRSASFVEPPGCLSGPPSMDNRAYWHAWPMVNFSLNGVDVGSFVGGGVKSIRVIRYNPKLTPDQIKREVLGVWRATLLHASNFIDWSEGSDWHIEAMVDHDDGSSSSLLFDNWMHLHVRDRIGKYWYMRIGLAPR